MGTCCERNSSYSFVPIVLKLCMCFLHGMRMCMWIAHNCWISFCHFLDIVKLVIFHPEYIDSGCLLSATPLTLLKLCVCFLHDMRMCMWFAYNCCINFCQFLPFIYRLCEHIPYNTIPILCPLLKLMLHLCPPPPSPLPAKKKLFFSYFRYKK